MDEYIIYTALAGIVTIVILVLSFFKSRSASDVGEEQDEAPVPERQRPVLPEAVHRDGGGPRNRAIANRNARARMRVAQAQRHQEDSEDEDPVDELGDEIALPEGKIGKKKLAKLQMKAEKRAMRESEERERQEKKEREEQKAEMRRQVEKEREEEEAKREEEERLLREEQEKKEQEEYEQMKGEFEVAEEGYDEEDNDEAQQSQLLKQFIDYIKTNKVVVLEELAALFSLKTQAVIDRITELQKEGDLTGVIDDRGKFIYISREELEKVAKFIKQRGRISISDLAEASNTLINLNPETSVKS